MKAPEALQCFCYRQSPLVGPNQHKQVHVLIFIYSPLSGLYRDRNHLNFAYLETMNKIGDNS